MCREVTKEEAARMGAFEEDALSEKEALESTQNGDGGE